MPERCGTGASPAHMQLAMHLVLEPLPDWAPLCRGFDEALTMRRSLKTSHSHSAAAAGAGMSDLVRRPL